LGPEANGVIATLNVYPSLFMTFGALGIRQSATHFIGKDKYPESSIKNSIAQIWIFSTIICLLFSFFLIRHFVSFGSNILWAILAISPIPFQLFITYNSGIFLGKNRISTYNKINWIPSFVNFCLTIILLCVFQLGINGALIAAISGPLVMFFLLLFRNDFIKSFSLRFDWEIIYSLLSLGIVYAISLLVINLNYKADIIMLDKMSTSYVTGIYSKGVSIVNYLWQIPMMLSTIVFARSAHAKDEKSFSIKVAQLLRVSIIIEGLCSIILIFTAKYIILFLYGEEYFDSIKVLQILLPGVLILTIFKVLNMDLAGKGKPWVSMKAMLPALIINIIMNYLFIPKYGANGAALASTISYSLAAIVFLVLYSKEVKFSIHDIFRYSKADLEVIKGIIIVLRGKKNEEI